MVIIGTSVSLSAFATMLPLVTINTGRSPVGSSAVRGQPVVCRGCKGNRIQGIASAIPKDGLEIPQRMGLIVDPC